MTTGMEAGRLERADEGLRLAAGRAVADGDGFDLEFASPGSARPSAASRISAADDAVG